MWNKSWLCGEWGPFLISCASSSCCCASSFRTAVDRRSEFAGESVGEWIQTESVTGAMNCTDSSKHDAISASYCYSLNPNTIRHSNTTIMRGARLTLSSTPSCLRYRFTIIFVKIWADKERNVRKRGGLYFNFSFLFLNANIRQCLYPVTPPYYVLMNLFLITRLLLREKKKRGVICSSGRSRLILAGGY